MQRCDTILKHFCLKLPLDAKKSRLVLVVNPVNTESGIVFFQNVRLLSQFVSPYTGEIYGRHITDLCVFMHRYVKKTIVKSRTLGKSICYLIRLTNILKCTGWNF